MDFAPVPSNAQSEPALAPARKVDSPSARPTHPATGKKLARRSQLFGFTIRLTPEQRNHFESLAVAQGYPSVAAAFKTQALSYGMEHPLQEMRVSLEHMQERITEEGEFLSTARSSSWKNRPRSPTMNRGTRASWSGRRRHSN